METTECIVCGETQYENVDGFYYCLSCNTQSQGFHQIESQTLETLPTQADFAHLLRKAPKIQSVSTDQQKTDETEHLIITPYTFYEILTIILRKQADFLIKNCGAPSVVKDTIIYLWMKYLKCRGIAYQQNNTDILEKFKMKEMNKPIKALLSTGRVLSEPHTAKFTEYNMKTRSVKPNQPYIFQQLCAKESLTIAICYLALLKSETFTILVSDLIRWAKLGQFPYLNSIDILPERIRAFAQVPQLLAKAKIMDAGVLHRLSITVGKYLEEPKLCFPIDNIDAITLLLHRFIMDLNLPRQIIPFIRAILSILPLNHEIKFDSLDVYNYLPKLLHRFPIEVKIYSYILVTLKLLFCLDDIEERKISSYATTLNLKKKNNDSSNKQSNCFVFMDWLTQCRLRNALLCGSPIESVLSQEFTEYSDQIHDQISATHVRLATMDHERDSHYVASTNKEFDEIFNNEIESDLTKTVAYFPLRDAVQNAIIDQRATDNKITIDKNSVGLIKYNFYDDTLEFMQEYNFSRNASLSDPSMLLIQDNLNRVFPFASQYHLFTRTSYLQHPEALEQIHKKCVDTVFSILNNEYFAENFRWILEFFANQLQVKPAWLYHFLDIVEFSLFKCKKSLIDGDYVLQNLFQCKNEMAK